MRPMQDRTLADLYNQRNKDRKRLATDKEYPVTVISNAAVVYGRIIRVQQQLKKVGVTRHEERIANIEDYAR